MSAASNMQEALARHSALVEECKRLQTNALQATQADVMHVDMGKSEFRNRSTVGLQLDGCVVDNMVVGGPAFNCRRIHEGDTILSIDGKTVTNDNIMTSLVGLDLPGSAVTLTLDQKGVTKDVSLKRMDSVIISGKLKLFDHFTRIKEKALAHSKDVPELAGMVDQCISAWTEMTVDEQQREAKQTQNVHDLQESCCKTHAELEMKLEELKAVAGKMQAFDSDLRTEINRLKADLEQSQTKCRSHEAELKALLEKINKLEKELVAHKSEAANSIASLKAKLEESQTKCHSLEAERDDDNARIKELVLALGKAELLNTSLIKQLDESQAREVKIKSDYLSASRELQDAQDKILELQRKMEQASKQISKLSDELANKESENAEATAKYRKLESEFRVAQAHISDLDFGKSKLEALLKESKEMLFSSEDNRNKLTSQLDEMQKRLTEKERQYMERGDKLDQQILEVSRLQYQVKDVETSLQKIIDRKSEAISKLESELGVMKKQETLLQEYLTEAKNAAKEIEMNNKQVTGEKCALEAELEGTVVRIRTLEAQLKEAVTGKVHFQAETDVLVPARDDLQRKLVGVELELSAHKDEIEYVTKDSVSLRSALQSEKTARQEAAKKLELAEEAHKKTEHDLRLIKSDLIQCTTELKTSTALAKTFEDRLSAANVKVDKLSTELRQYSLKCDALELKTKDAEDGLGSAVETIKKQKAELSSLVDKIEANEREITRLRAHADTLELRLHERTEKERRLQQEIDEIRLSLNLEIKQNAMTQSSLLQAQALNRSLERELDEARNEGYNVKCKFRTVEELDKEHVNKICEMEVELASTRATMKKESSELQQMIVMTRRAIEQIHHAVFPKTPTSYASADSKELIARLEKEVTAEVKNMQNMIIRLQQQANAIPAHVAEIEKLRMQVQNANLAKTFAERQRAEANEIIERLKDELGKNKGKIATLEESLRTARALHAASEKKVLGVQSDLDTSIEKNRQELSVLNKEIIQLRELEKDNQMLAEEVRRINEENDSFKQLLKASLAAQEQTAEALCGKFEGRAGPGLLVQVVNGVTRVTSVIPGSCVSNSDSVSGLQLRPGDIIPMLRSGDIIEKVDDVSIAGATLSAVQDLLFGPIESAVTLTFFRNVSGVKSLAEPRFRVTLQRMDTSSHVEGFAQRAHDMCSAAGCLRVKARDLEEKVDSVTATLERKEADIRSLHQAREESVKLIYELEQRVRARDIELQAIRAEEVSVRHKLQSAALEIEGLNLQRVKADEVIAFSQHRIKNLDEKNGALERRKKEVTSALEAAERRAASLSDQFSELQNSYAVLGEQIRMVQSRCSQAESELMEMVTLNRRLLDAMQGHIDERQGVGMTVGVANVVVIKSMDAVGAAANCGLLQEGDVLKECDGKPLVGLSAHQVQNLILGRSGTQVSFLVRQQTGKCLSVVLVRGDHRPKNFPDQMREAVNCADATNVEVKMLRQLVKSLVSQLHIRDGDVDRTLTKLEQSFEDARLSWLDLSSSVPAFSARENARKSSRFMDESDSRGSVNSCNYFEAQIRTEVENDTQKCRASLACVTDLTQMLLLQITDLVKMRAELKESLAKESRIRYQQEEAAVKLKNDLGEAKAQFERDLAEMNKKLIHLSRTYNQLLLDNSEAMDFEAQIHAILRKKEFELSGVGMVLKLERGSRYPQIESLAPGGGAVECGELSVGDYILTVNGKDLAGMELENVTPLFLGPLGSSVTVVVAKGSIVGSKAYESKGFDALRDWGLHFGLTRSRERAHSITVTLERSVGTSLVRGAKSSSISKETSKETSELKHTTALTKPTKEAFDVHRLKRDRAESLELARSYSFGLTTDESAELKALVARLRAEVELRTQQALAADMALETLQERLKEDKVRSTGLERRIDEYERQLKDATEAMSVLNIQNSSLTAEVASLKAKLAQSIAHAEEYQRQLKEAQQAMLQLNMQDSSLTEEVTSLRETLEVQLLTPEELLARIMAQAEAAETDAQDSRKKLQIALNEIDTLRATIEKLKGHIDDLTRRAEQAEKNEEDLRKRVELADKELEVAGARIEAMQARVDEATQLLSESECEKGRITKELTAALSEIQRLLALAKDREVLLTRFEGDVGEKSDTIRELQYKLDSCPYKCLKIVFPTEEPPTESEEGHDMTKYVGVGMVVRVDTRNPYPLIKKIFPDGSAAECALMAVEDALLEVDGIDCKHKTVADMTALFLGPVGSSVVVKGHTLADHSHPPDKPSYTVTLIRGKPGSPRKIPTPSPRSRPPSFFAPMQTNSDDERLSRANGEINELRKQLAAARENSEKLTRRCAEIEASAHKEQVEERIRQAASAAAETQRALDAASQKILKLQEELESKDETIRKQFQETSELKGTLLQMENEAATLQIKLSVTLEEVDGLQKLVKELKSSASTSRNELNQLLQRLDEIQVEAETLRQSERDLTVALRSMSEAEKSGKEKIQALEGELNLAHARLERVMIFSPGNENVSPTQVVSTPQSAPFSAPQEQGRKSRDRNQEIKIIERPIVSQGSLFTSAADRNQEIKIIERQMVSQGGSLFTSAATLQAPADAVGDGKGLRSRPSSSKSVNRSQPPSPANVTTPRSVTSSAPRSVTSAPTLRDVKGSGALALGVGVAMEISDYAPHVVKRLVEGGPAERCGKILVGDTLIAIDGNEIASLHIDLIKAMLAGDAGSTVNLTLVGKVDEEGVGVNGNSQDDMVLAVQAAVPPPYTVQVTRGKVKPRSKGGASDGLQAAASERLAAALLNDSQ